MMYADQQQLVVLSAMFPSWIWRVAIGRRVVVASDGVVIRAYWIPALLWLDEFRALLFVQQLNASVVSRGFDE
ncbi:hypothetical protein BZK31_14895 [Pseudomonas floridensis]|uniref:Uncharacterized protein n=1 Tax=Pseudomonas floridensis TaxID=1958950 RepID=A0A1X0N5F1_9PSED|nr:hypothetical protein [Pseudomonas floridensis]ORC58562.1 hypothetical protein BZK31_14895 [Pseudomonas floridensis]